MSCLGIVIGNLLADFYSDKGLKYEQSMQKKLRLVSRYSSKESLVELGAVFFSIPPVGFGCDLEAPQAPLLLHFQHFPLTHREADESRPTAL